MKIVKADKKGIKLAVRYLKAGKSVVYPTDTAYGLGVDATNILAVKKLYKIKERSRNQPVHVIVANLPMAKKYARLDEFAERLFREFLPGPLTLVSSLSLDLSPPASRQGGRQGRGMRVLSAGTGTIGIRMPKSRIALALVKKLDRPITTTSANPGGGKTPYSVAAVQRQFGRRAQKPDLYLDAGRLPIRKPSTVVGLKQGQLVIFREGPITKKQIQKVVAGGL